MPVSQLPVSVTTIETVQVVKVERRPFGDKIKTAFDLIMHSVRFVLPKTLVSFSLNQGPRL